MYLYMQYLTRMVQGSLIVKPNNITDQIAGECLMGRIRMITRVLTGIYEEELRPFGLKASQLNLLVVVAKAGPVRRIDIGKMLNLDPSTLTRNLRVMLAQGWIEERRGGDDGRGDPLRITVKGQHLLERIGPAWRKAQARTRRLLGEHGETIVRKLSDKLMTGNA